MSFFYTFLSTRSTFRTTNIIIRESDTYCSFGGCYKGEEMKVSQNGNLERKVRDWQEERRHGSSVCRWVVMQSKPNFPSTFHFACFHPCLTA